MCGIVAATSKHRNVVPLLVQGLKRLEYRGYDSCGVAVWNQGLKRVRSVSRVSELSEQINKDQLQGFLGIAHTRWLRTANRWFAMRIRIFPATKLP